MATQFLITCKTDYEKILAREVALYNFTPQTKGQGWILAQANDETFTKENETQTIIPCFAHSIRENPIPVSASSVNSLTDELINLFTTNLGTKRITDSWAFQFSSSGSEQLIHRAKSVEKHWLDKLQKKMSRVAKLAREGIPFSASFAQGFFVHFTDFNQVFVSFKALSAGQQRMLMDPKSPSRSYLKLEEAFRIYGHEPKRNEKVIDLGAAPGGWSYSALKRGALVIAIDNGPLKDPVKLHYNMRHLKVDALKFTYDYPKPVDWLLCDILEKPEIILELLHQWLGNKWCNNFIINIKVGRNDPIVLLNKIRNYEDGLLPYCQSLHIRQLYHDREEITLMGQTK